MLNSTSCCLTSAVQDGERHHGVHHACLLIADAGSVGALGVHAKGPGRGPAASACTPIAKASNTMVITPVRRMPRMARLLIDCEKR
jgi:hypothetical protein